MTVFSGGVRSSTDTSHWHPFSSYTSSVPRAVSAARENCQLNTTTSNLKRAVELVSHRNRGNSQTELINQDLYKVSQLFFPELFLLLFLQSHQFYVICHEYLPELFSTGKMKMLTHCISFSGDGFVLIHPCSFAQFFETNSQCLNNSCLELGKQSMDT